MITWTDDLIKTLVASWNEGLSYSQCSEIVTRTHGTYVSRSAVAGMVNRLRNNTDKIKRNRAVGTHKHKAVSAITVRKQGRPAGARKPAKTYVQPPSPDAATKGYGPEGGVTFVDLERHHCRFGFVNVDPRRAALDQRFCGAKKKPGSSYCETHHALTHNREATKRRRKRKTPQERAELARMQTAQRRVFGG